MIYEPHGVALFTVELRDLERNPSAAAELEAIVDHRFERRGKCVETGLDWETGGWVDQRDGASA